MDSHQDFCGARRNRTSDLSIIRTALTPEYTPPDQHVYSSEKAIGRFVPHERRHQQSLKVGFGDYQS